MKKFALPLLNILVIIFLSSCIGGNNFILTGLENMKLENLTIKNTFELQISSKITGLETEFYCGVIEQLPIDVERLIPRLKNIYKESHTVVWAYEMEINSIERKDNTIELKGVNHKGSNTLFYVLVPREKFYNVSSIVAIGNQK